jgi:hypothetical protein
VQTQQRHRSALQLYRMGLDGLLQPRWSPFTARVRCSRSMWSGMSPSPCDVPAPVPVPCHACWSSCTWEGLAGLDGPLARRGCGSCTPSVKQRPPARCGASCACIYAAVNLRQLRTDAVTRRQAPWPCGRQGREAGGGQGRSPTSNWCYGLFATATVSMTCRIVDHCVSSTPTWLA